MAATAESVVKPDFQATRKHFIFSDEHEQLRESITSFATKELAPHAEEWEETTFPDWVFTRMGELGFLGLDKPERYGGQGGDYFSAIALSAVAAMDRRLLVRVRSAPAGRCAGRPAVAEQCLRAPRARSPKANARRRKSKQ